jgi:hypothetical protein
MESRTKRRHLFLYLEILDPATHELIGHLGDISKDGLMIICNHPMPLRQLRDIRIKLPETEEFPKKYIDLTVETRWSKPDVNPALYCIGCHFADYAEDDMPLIQQVAELLTFEG